MWCARCLENTALEEAVGRTPVFVAVALYLLGRRVLELLLPSLGFCC